MAFLSKEIYIKKTKTRHKRRTNLCKRKNVNALFNWINWEKNIFSHRKVHFLFTINGNIIIFCGMAA